ncbi:hypothetical protein [uncultured Pontibacter sp.]|uniref:hypothetical protein n=1 Tax=uncultured Pontibacter sp. TaxID=453356 RepID=UPI00260E4D10|nr:hypothetical protein [uncultured Pontibacter sp.]
MKYYGSKAVKSGLESGVCAVLSAIQPAKAYTQVEAAIDFSTIDGEVIDSSVGSDAVKKGNGLFIGGYFVGILDSFSGIGNTPFLRY